ILSLVFLLLAMIYHPKFAYISPHPQFVLRHGVPGKSIFRRHTAFEEIAVLRNAVFERGQL
ncbi:MAG: hypothetical protein LIO94_04475, partial [Clostridiales bacterium]|nr:hypothetical protein [Clostridiales bacterium]